MTHKSAQGTRAISLWSIILVLYYTMNVCAWHLLQRRLQITHNSQRHKQIPNKIWRWIQSSKTDKFIILRGFIFGSPGQLNVRNFGNKYRTLWTSEKLYWKLTVWRLMRGTLKHIIWWVNQGLTWYMQIPISKPQSSQSGYNLWWGQVLRSGLKCQLGPDITRLCGKLWWQLNSHLTLQMAQLNDTWANTAERRFDNVACNVDLNITQV